MFALWGRQMARGVLGGRGSHSDITTRLQVVAGETEPAFGIVHDQLVRT